MLGFFSSKCLMKSLAGWEGRRKKHREKGYFLLVPRYEPNRAWPRLVGKHHKGQPQEGGVLLHYAKKGRHLY